MRGMQVKTEEQAKDHGRSVITSDAQVDAGLKCLLDADEEHELSVEELAMLLDIFNLAKDGLKYRGGK